MRWISAAFQPPFPAAVGAAYLGRCRGYITRRGASGTPLVGRPPPMAARTTRPGGPALAGSRRPPAGPPVRAEPRTNARGRGGPGQPQPCRRRGRRPRGRGAGLQVALGTGRPGPPVDRAMLRYLGRISAPSYRAYLGLCCEWDRTGGHNGRLILPTRPAVRRAPTGYVVGGSGNILLGSGQRPVESPYDPRAIRTGDREVNPARIRHTEYNADGVAALCYSPDLLNQLPSMTASARWMYYRRARKYIELIEQAGGCQIERLGEDPRKGHLPWRIMPRTPLKSLAGDTASSKMRSGTQC